MKTKIVTAAILTAGIMLGAVTGCSSRENISQTLDPGEDYSTNSSESSPEKVSEPQEEFAVKLFEKEIDFDGRVVYSLPQLENLFLSAIDNDYVYLSSNSFPSIVSALDRNNYASLENVMTFDCNYGVGGSKHTLCGCYFDFGYGGGLPYEDGTGFDVRTLYGKVGEEPKSITAFASGPLRGEPAELSDTEMVYICYVDDVYTINIYKYKIGDEQAQLIYTKSLDKSAHDGGQAIACCNGQIFLAYRSESYSSADIIILNADGVVESVETIGLPEGAEPHINNLEATENYYIIDYRSTPDRGVVGKTALVERKSKRVFSDFDENSIGTRRNEGMIDGRYLIYFKRCASNENPRICIFDDKNLECHTLKFTNLVGENVISMTANNSGDVMFMVKDENGARSLVLYENVTSLIQS